MDDSIVRVGQDRAICLEKRLAVTGRRARTQKETTELKIRWICVKPQDELQRRSSKYLQLLEGPVGVGLSRDELVQRVPRVFIVRRGANDRIG